MTGERDFLVGKRVTVIGLGIEGVDVARYAATHGASVVVVSQSVPLDAPALDEARELGIPVDSMTRAFMEHCPGPMVGITGSSGKTTTTSLVAAMFAAAERPYRVGGNIGGGLL